MEDKQNQLFIQKDPGALREQWLRKDPWSLSEFINLCCGSLDGTRSIHPGRRSDLRNTRSVLNHKERNSCRRNY